ncbi:MAG: hypothetical protein NTV34_18595, partial [Proteobacteria bacterium]|nr:hypothetical protein [Pseudomonadota bacterium]
MQLQDSKQPGMNILWEDEDSAFEPDLKLNSDFAIMLAGNATTSEIKEGMIVKGLVIRYNEDNIVIDIGHKSEGEVPK